MYINVADTEGTFYFLNIKLINTNKKKKIN